MKANTLEINRLVTDRLILIPFTISICRNVLNNDFTDVFNMGLKKGRSWPDADVIETLPKIITNLSLVESPTGFESWMIVKKETLEIIGDLGFKGYNYREQNADIGYGIIHEERGNGFATEAVTTLIRWAFSQHMMREITASCLIGNTDSVNLLRKLHFSQVRQDHEMIYWSLQKE